jgi:CHAT domain-containing protein
MSDTLEVLLKARERKFLWPEALSDLARAFFYAGARALLVSHWSDDSEATTRLTASTFAATAPIRSSAARRPCATRSGLHERQGSPLNAYPALWAPFSIIGEGTAR